MAKRRREEHVGHYFQCVWEESAFFTGCSALTLALDFLPKSQLWVERRLPEKGRVGATYFPVSSGNLAQQRKTLQVND